MFDFQLRENDEIIMLKHELKILELVQLGLKKYIHKNMSNLLLQYLSPEKISNNYKLSQFLDIIKNRNIEEMNEDIDVCDNKIIQLSLYIFKQI